MKICSKCKINKPLNEFAKRSDNRLYWCISCTKEYQYNYSLNHKKERKEYLKNNSFIKDKQREYIRNKRNTDINHKIINNLRTRIYSGLNGITKSDNTFNLVGCSIERLKKYLQQTATKNGYKDFDINNYSGREYHIDHIVPISNFNLKCSYHQRLCFNWSNLQILTKEKNLLKSDN